MTLDEYNSFCRKLPHTAHVVQWGGAHVWKVGGAKGKVFAVAGWEAGEGDELAVTFKCSQMTFDLLKDKPGMRPAPYLASRGMIWLQRTGHTTVDDAALLAYVRESHRLVAAGLPKKARLALGLPG